MKAEDKLDEASYFLSKIKELPDSINKRKELGYNLDAFVQAWRGVFDVLLNDYAEKYFKYSPERKFKIRRFEFEKIAEVLDNHGVPEPKKFIKWYEKKVKLLINDKSRFYNLGYYIFIQVERYLSLLLNQNMF